MKKRFLIIALLAVSIFTVMMLSQVKSAKAIDNFEGPGSGYYLTWNDLGTCKKCIPASTSCNVSSQCCRSWGNCN